MNAWIALIIGFALGFLAKWAYDNFLGSGAANAAGQAGELRSRSGEAEDVQAFPNGQPRIVFKEKDRLEEIKGIGPVFASRLNEAGIYTFAELGAATPGRLREIIKPQDWQAIDPESWIAEAQQLAAARA